MKTVFVLAALWATIVAESPHHQGLTAFLRLLDDPERLYEPAIAAKSARPNCLQDLKYYVDTISNITGQGVVPSWALQMFDSSTKVPEGIFMGNLVQLGNYDECLNVTDVPSSEWTFDGQHCLVTLTVQQAASPSVAERALMSAQELGRSSVNGNMGNVVAAFEGLKLQIAQCIPSTCSAAELKAALNLFLKMNPTLGNVQADVNPDQCHTIKKRHHLRAVDWFAIVFLLFFIIIAAASTAYDLLCRMKEVKGSPILLSFSVYSNWLRLISINSSSETMTAVNGIRFISMGWVVLGHRYLVVSGLPSINMVYLNNFKKDWSRLTIMNATVSVDTFFLLSGLLTSYVFLKEMEKRGRFNILLFYVHRYIRLTPALAVMILMTATLFNYGGEGPLWDSRNRVYREACEKNWWANLLYINNYYDAGNMCLGQTWYLAVDMQLHFLSPLILIPLWKKPRLSQLLLIVLMLAGWATAFTVPYVEKYWAGVWTGPVELRAVSELHNYYPTHTRFMPWLMGIALGYWIRQAKKIKFRMTSFQIVLGWLLSTFLMVGSLHLAYPFQQPEYVYSRLESSFYLSLFRPAWSLGVAWIIFASDLGYGGFPNIILSWRIFQPLGRLSYGIYLTHITVIIILTASVKTPVYLADVSTIPQFMGDLLISIGFAIPLVLLFESPIILLEKRLLGPKDNRTAQPSHEGVLTLERQLAQQERQKGGV